MSKNNIERISGRAPDELRNVSIKAGVIKNADGSALIEFGKNKILSKRQGNLRFLNVTNRF